MLKGALQPFSLCASLPTTAFPASGLLRAHFQPTSRSEVVRDILTLRVTRFALMSLLSTLGGPVDVCGGPGPWS